MFVVPRSTQLPQNTDSRDGVAPSRGSGTFRLAVDTGAGRGSALSTGRNSSQNPVTLAPAAENLPRVPWPAGPVATPPPSPGVAGIGVQKLLDALAALGMSTAGLNISYSEEAVGYPGGSYMNRQIKVTSGGKTEQFSAELTERNPLVTAYEMQRYLGVASNAGGAGGTVRHG